MIKIPIDYYDECLIKIKEKMGVGREFYFMPGRTQYIVREIDERNMKVLGEDIDGNKKWLHVNGYDFKTILKDIKPLRISKKRRRKRL